MLSMATIYLLIFPHAQQAARWEFDGGALQNLDILELGIPWMLVSWEFSPAARLELHSDFMLCSILL